MIRIIPSLVPLYKGSYLYSSGRGTSPRTRTLRHLPNSLRQRPQRISRSCWVGTSRKPSDGASDDPRLLAAECDPSLLAAVKRGLTRSTMGSWAIMGVPARCNETGSKLATPTPVRSACLSCSRSSAWWAPWSDWPGPRTQIEPTLKTPANQSLLRRAIRVTRLLPISPGNPSRMGPPCELVWLNPAVTTPRACVVSRRVDRSPFG
jgi:hypothetical protein